jgi:hypothetical protein
MTAANDLAIRRDLETIDVEFIGKTAAVAGPHKYMYQYMIQRLALCIIC